MDKESLSGQMESATRVSTKIIRKVAKALCLGQMASAKMELGLMENMLTTRLID